MIERNRWWALAAVLAAAPVHAQPGATPSIGLRPPTGATAPVQPGPAIRAPAPAPRPASNAPIALERVVAVVNDEAVTSFEMNEQKRILVQSMREARLQPPAPDVLDKQVLERLITERALLQFAKETGIRIDDTTVDRTIQRIAQENKFSLEEFRQVLQKEGIPYARYREDVRRELVIQRLRDREVESRLFITDAEVDNYLATVSAQSGGENEYLISHILVRVAEQSSPEQIDRRRARAEEALKRVLGGEDFAQVAVAYSDASDAQAGASLGWRTPARLPSVFVDPVRGLKKGETSGVLRSPAGFHVVKLVDLRSRDAPTVVDQVRARHILVKVSELTSEAEAKARIDRARERIEGGAKFEELARVSSEDASSARGGDLGWLSPGDTVPEFDKAMAALALNELSQPVRTPFGWHLIQVLERRTQDVSKDRQREQARLALRQRKSEEQFGEFVRQTRDRAYVEIKSDER